MCRLMMGHKSAIREYDRKHGLIQLLNYLEKQLGGHGNGVVFMKNGEIVEGRKGVKLSNEEICTMEINLDYDWMIYHTRLVSVGSKTDSQCHPYWEGNDVLAMNGTDMDFSNVADAMGTSDSDIIFRVLRGTTPEQAMEILGHIDAIFVGAIDGKPIASSSPLGDLCRWGKKMFASSFPKGVPSTLMNGEGWIDGKLKIRKDDRRSYRYAYHWEDDPWMRDYKRESKREPQYGEYELGYEDGRDDGFKEGYAVGYRDGVDGYSFDDNPWEETEIDNAA